MVYIIILAIAALFGPHLWARHVLNRYNRLEYFSGSGIDLARLVLERLNLNDVTVEMTDTGDHYDPAEKTIRLTKKVCGHRTLTAVVVAAHEVGHAIQDHSGYKPLKTRTRMIGTAQKLERFGAIIRKEIKMAKKSLAILAIVLATIPIMPLASFAFEFDVWKSGMTIAQAIKTAQTHDIPLTPAGVSEAGRRGEMHFQLEMDESVKKYSNFCYQDKIMGNAALVTLHFTPMSKKLSHICIFWPEADAAQHTEVVLKLTEKYGNPLKYSPIKDPLPRVAGVQPEMAFSQGQYFEMDRQNMISVQPTGESSTALFLNYTDLPLNRMEHTENQTLKKYIEIRYRQQDENRM